MRINDVVLAFDIGTGSARVGLIDREGKVLEKWAEPHRTSFPGHGLAEQEPGTWWRGLCTAIGNVLNTPFGRSHRIVAICGCGQMHAPVLLDANQTLLTPTVQLWNDKRAGSIAARLDGDPRFAAAGNPPTSAWPGLKLKWLADNQPDVLEQAAVVLMPKDFINFRLTGQIAQDRTEAGSSFLFNTQTEDWNPALATTLDIPPSILPPLLAPNAVLGHVTDAAAAATSLPGGIPVFVGGGDFPVSVLGSGVYRSGDASDISGTSALISVLGNHPVSAPNVMNAAAPETYWATFGVVDAAGESLQWARRELGDSTLSFHQMEAIASQAPPGAESLIFLPYLTGERLGHGARSRGAFVGMTAGHTKAHMFRAVFEGIAMALHSAAQPVFASVARPDHIVAAGGGARSELMLATKSAVFDLPFIPVSEVECGLMGCAALAFSGLGVDADIGASVERIVHHRRPVHPDPGLRATYLGYLEAYEVARSTVWEVSARLSALA